MTFARWAILLLFLSSVSIPAISSDFPAVTPDELKMTGIPEQPGAPAVILNREETDSDMLNEHTVYERIKILTDAGREQGNVEIPYNRRGFSVSGISGQTVHTDGTVIPFAGKPFDKTVMKGAGYKVNVKSFSLPDVQVGSVIDYRYSLRYEDNMLLPPTWEVQTDLFQRKAYFKFIPFQTHASMYIQLAHGQIAQGVAWVPIVGNGVGPEFHQNPRGSGFAATGQISSWVDLRESNVPALVEEPDMPPTSILRWRVHFYYQETRNVDDYWKAQSKFWNKDAEGFLHKDRGINAAVTQIIAPSDTPEQKVRKIYTFVSQLENQSYIPERTQQEEKVLELKEDKGSEDVLEHRSGSHDDLNRLFVSMVRAAGIPASLIWVPDRSRAVFLKQFLSTYQLDAEIAIVQLEGKDVFLDPGSKFCPYGIVDWRYSGVSGLRQSAKGAEFGETPSPDYKQAVATRMAVLSLDKNGAARGQIGLVFKGLEAMLRRQEGGKTDADGRKKLLEDSLREILPGNSDVSLINQPDWDTTDAPLVAQFRVSFPYAVISGKHLLLQQHLFQVSEHSRFSAPQRINTVYFHYPWEEADEVHITLPAGMEVESLAPDDKLQTDYAGYQVTQKNEAAGKISSRRDFIMNGMAIPPDQYTQLKSFYDRVKTDDDQPALLKVGSDVASTE